MAKQDLRTWIAEVEAAGQLQKISGAEREEEIGGIVDVYQRKIGNKAVLFDDIPGYPTGYRVLANILTSVPQDQLDARAARRGQRDRSGQFLAALHEGSQVHPADHRRQGLGAGECQRRQRA